MRSPLELAGVRLTPYVLFWAYKKANKKCVAFRHDMKASWNIYAWENADENYGRYARLRRDIDRRLDRILQEALNADNI